MSGEDNVGISTENTSLLSDSQHLKATMTGIKILLDVVVPKEVIVSRLKPNDEGDKADNGDEETPSKGEGEEKMEKQAADEGKNDPLSSTSSSSSNAMSDTNEQIKVTDQGNNMGDKDDVSSSITSQRKVAWLDILPVEQQSYVLALLSDESYSDL